MIRLVRLYSTPEIFEPIVFELGLNLILGERSEGSNKTNGVGKSICIEFLNYCLLKRQSDSRVTLVPKHVIDQSAVISLDLKIDNYFITISRAINTPDIVRVIKDNVVIDFGSLDEASDFLGNLYFEKYPAYTDRISFRTLLAPVIRDERSEFKDIIKCFDTDKTIPRDYRPHLFFLGFGLTLYNELAKLIDQLQKKAKYLTETKRLLTNNNQITVADAKAKLNELESEVTKINLSMEQFRSNDSFELVQSELVSLDAELKEIREQQKVLRYKIKQIDILPQPESISDGEMAILFNEFKKGLGDMIQKSLNEVIAFKSKIDNFRNTIVNNNLAKLKSDLQTLTQKAKKLDDLYSEKVKILDNGELLGNLKTAIRIFNEKNQALSTLRTLVDQYNDSEKQKKTLLSQKNSKISEFDGMISEHKIVIDSFEQTVLDIHEKIFGNKQSHFEIGTKLSSQSREFISFDLRTDDDHSWSTERIKVFIYDMALMFNEYTRAYHPQFLVHDNIFNVDNDSLEKSLNYVYHQTINRGEEFQYILTINRDMIEGMESKKMLDFKVEEFVRAKFTKENRFLKVKYNEVQKKK